MKKLLLRLCPCLLFASCYLQQASRISSNTIHPGMTKSEAISRLGQPYKSSFHYAKDSAFMESLYYKEIVWKAEHYSITSILNFKNEALVSVKQGREFPLDSNDD